MNNLHHPTKYNNYYLAATLITKLCREELKNNQYGYNKKYTSSRRLIESTFLYLCTNHNNQRLGTGNIIEFEKDLNDIISKVLNIYFLPVPTLNIFDDYFYKVEMKKSGFIPFYNYDNRQEYYKELKNTSTDDLKKALVLDFLAPDRWGYTWWDDIFYIVNIDWCDFKVLDNISNDYNNYFDGYDPYCLGFEDCLNIQYDDIDIFLKDNPSLSEKLDYLECISTDYLINYAEYMGISRDCLEVHNIDYYE